MKVKIGDHVYDSENEKIVIVLSEQDKKNIAAMHPYATKYCAYPVDAVNTVEYIIDWMGRIAKKK